MSRQNYTCSALQRLLSTATLVGLLVATAAAFAITEKLKLEKSPVTGVQVTKTFSPVCRCSHSRALIRVKLRRADTVTVTLLDRHGHVAATLATARAVPRGWSAYGWNGILDDGRLARRGTYDVRVHLAARRSTIVLPAPDQVTVDTRPPQVLSAVPNRDTFSPDGDHQADDVRIDYRLSEGARVLLFLDGRRILKTNRHPQAGTVTWYGVLPDGRRLPAGTYTLELGAVDPAGNTTPKPARWPLRLTIRYIVLASHRIPVPAGGRIAIGVSTDAKRYGWRLGKRSGTARGPVLRVAAPQSPGRYTLTVTEHGHSDRAAVIVR